MNDAKPFVAIVDDDAAVGRSTRRLLHSFGIEADAFAGGEELLELLEAMPAYRPACAILDVQMPGLNGLEIQQRLAPRAIPVIFITAHDDSGVQQRALAAGALAFLRKPFRDEILLKAVRAAFACGPAATEKA